MYSVATRIAFCYGHRLMDYDGVCNRPHGHNAVAEIRVDSDSTDSRNMVIDFGDITRIIKGWIDRELDHKIILRRDDPLAAALRSLAEPVFIVDANPTAELIAKLIFDQGRIAGIPVTQVKVWENANSFAAFSGSTEPGRLL